MSGFNLRKYFFLLAIFIFASTAHAATFTISTPTANGTFTLTWSGVRTYAELYEKVNGSMQKIGDKYNTSGSLDITKPPGTYTFVLGDILVYGNQSGGPYTTGTTIEKSVTVAALTAPPSIPASITVIPDDFTDSITVSWPSAAGATRYELERNGVNVYSGSATATTPPNSLANTSYTFRVSACNSYGCSGWRTASAVTLQETFGVPAASNTGQFNITIKTPGDATHTRIEESSSANGPWNTIATLQGNQSHPLTRNNGTYYYRLLYCVFGTQTSTCSLRNQIKSIVVSQPAPTVSASFSPLTINEGGSSTLNWSSSNSTSCSASGIAGVSSTSGSTTYTAPSAMSANATVNVTITCSGGGGNKQVATSLNVNWVNDLPSISGIASRTINEDSSTGAIGFTVGDEETSAGALEVTATSSNTTLIPDGNLVLGGSGASRTINVTPAANAFGSATIFVRAKDAHNGVSQQSFTVTVNSVDDAPVISALGNITINELAETTVGFSVSDIDSGVSGVSATSNSPTLVTSTLGGGGNDYSVTLKAGRFTTSGTSGQATIKVSVPFGSNPVERTFTVTVNNLEPKLWIEETGTTGVYDVKWDYAASAAKIYENGADITTTINSQGYAGPVGTKRITKTANGTFTYYIQDCVGVTLQGLTCSGTYSQKQITVTFPKPVVTVNFDKTAVNESNAGATNTTSTLTWSATNANSCSATGISGVSGISGTTTYTAPSSLVTNSTHTVTVTCIGNGGSTPVNAQINLTALNDKPGSSIQTNTAVNEDQAFFIPFTAMDEETPLANLDITAVSGDTGKIPQANIVVDKTNSRLQVTPAANAHGSVAITLKVKDPQGLSAADVIANITLSSVDDAPVISAISNVSVNELAEINVGVTVTDIDSGISGVEVVSDSPTSVTPTLSGSGNSYSIKINAARISTSTSNTQAKITVKVPFGATFVMREFTVTVNNLTPQLWIEETGTVGVYDVKWDLATSAAKIYENGADITTTINSQGYAGPVGTKRFTKTANGTFTYYIQDCVGVTLQGLTCSGTYSQKQITVTFPKPVVTVNFDKTAVNESNAGAANTTSTLTWSATNANSCSATGISGVSGISGTTTYTAPSSLVTNSTHTVTVTCIGNGGSTPANTQINLTALNDSPVISAIASPVAINEDTNTGAIGFTVSDEETTATDLTVTATSSNQTLVPNGNIQLGGSGTNRTVTATPVANLSGSAEITVTVKDANNAQVIRKFTVNVAAVDDAPVISAISNVSVNELAETNVNFTVTDIDSGISGVEAVSDSPTSVTPTLSGSGNSYSIKINAARISTSTSNTQSKITVKVPFGATFVMREFTVTVNNLTPQLWIEETGTIGVYDVKWDLATSAAKIFENGADITTTINSQGYAGPVGTKRITKTANGTFTYYIQDCVGVTLQGLTCSGTYSQKQITVTFPKPVVTVNFDKTAVNESNAGATNTTSTLTWSATNANSCSATGISGVSGTSGTATYTAPSTLVANGTHTVTVTCIGNGGSTPTNAQINLTALNDSPVISAIASPVAINEDTSTGAIGFTVSDEETAATDLTVTATSSNQTLVPNGNIQLGGSGTNRTVTATPVANLSGSAEITVTVKDANNAQVIRKFTVNVAAVDDAPVISAISNVSVNELAETNVNFTVTDIDSPVSGVTVTSNSPTLVTPTLNGSGNNYSINIKAARLSTTTSAGQATLTVDVPTEEGSSSRSFTVTVNNVAPTLLIEETGTIGVYDIKWDFATSGAKIYENGADITHTINSQGYAGPVGTKRITKTANGTFTYYIQDCVGVTLQGLTCSGTYSQKQITVTFPKPVVTASFDKSEINENNPGSTNTSSKLTWSATHATSCQSVGVNGVSGVSGNLTYVAPVNVISDMVIFATVTCTGPGGSGEALTGITVKAFNDLPTISAIASPVVINEDANTGAIAFTVSDEETAANDLTVTAISSNQTLIPDGNIQRGGSGANRTITATPAANQFGSAVITVTVKDANNVQATRQFTVNVTAVDDAPVISAISNVTLNEMAEVNLNFTVTDIDSPVSGISAISSSPTLVTPTVSGSGSNYSVNLKAARFATAGSSGQADVTVQIPFGATTVSRTFNVTVYNLEPQLWIEETGIIGVYDVKWDYATSAAKLFQNGTDITQSINSQGFVGPVGTQRFTKTTSGTYTYYIQDCMGVTLQGMTCSGIYSQKQITVTLPISSSSSSAQVSSSISSSKSSSSSSSISSSARSLPAGIVDPINDDMTEADYLGALSGQHTVDKNGTFSYQIPIEVAPGIGSIQPKISLVYNSQNKQNGLIGWGWVLEGISVIERCKADLTRDGYISGINAGENYKYCLNGQRLVSVSAGHYRLENESYLKIEEKPGYWMVTDKAGLKQTFGMTTNSTLTDGTGAVYAWYLDKEEDISGNYLTVTYETDTAGQNFRPKLIAYTRNDTAEVNLNNTVEFNYVERPDSIERFIAGARKLFSQRLSNIVVKANGDLVRTYFLDYQAFGQTYFGKTNEDPTQTSRLYRVMECLSDTSCKEPVQFDWTSVEKSAYAFRENSTFIYEEYFPPLDLSGIFPDGGQSNVGGEFTGNQDVLFLVGDFDGDGIAEKRWKKNPLVPPLGLPEEVYSKNRIHRHDIDPSLDLPLVNVLPSGVTSLCPEGSGKCNLHQLDIVAADINGDGRDDVLFPATISYNWSETPGAPTGDYVDGLLVSLSQGNRSFEGLKLAFPSVRQSHPHTSVFIDFDGDNLVDRLSYNFFVNSLQLRKNQGGSFGSMVNVIGSQANMLNLWRHQFDDVYSKNIWYNLKFGDFNGDGLIDIYGCAQTAKNSTNCYPNVMLNKNGTFGNPIRWGDNLLKRNKGGLSPADHVIGSDKYTRGEFLADMNGDGLTDLVHNDYYDTKDVHVALSDGTKFLPFQNWTAVRKVVGSTVAIRYGDEYGIGGGVMLDGKYTSWKGLSLADMNNDGCADLVGNGVYLDPESGLQPWDEAFTGILVSLSTCSANNGSGFATPIVWSTSGKFQNRTIIGTGAESPAALFDLDGKGGLDSFHGVSKFQDHKILAVHAGINNLLGLSVTYSPLTDPAVYTNSSQSIETGTETRREISSKQLNYSPVLAYEVSVRDPLEVVSSLNVADGIGGTRETQYTYEGYKRHKLGYGPLGFEKIITTEKMSATTNIVVVDEYLQEFTNQYLLVGAPKKSTKSLVVNGQSTLLAEMNYNWKVRVFNDDTDSYQSPHFLPYIVEQHTQNFEMNSGTWVGTITQRLFASEPTDECAEFEALIQDDRVTTTAEHIDDYGTVFNTEVIHCDPFGATGTRTENTNIVNNTASWQLGLVEDPYVHSWIYDRESGTLSDQKTRHSTFYFDSLGRVSTEIKEPESAADIQIEQSRTYNEYGSIDSITEAVQDFADDGVDFTLRTIFKSETYDENGRRTVETRNDYGHVLTQIYEPKFGNEEGIIDVNGLLVSNEYDVAGRLKQIINPSGVITDVFYKKCSNCFEYSSAAAWYVQTKTTGLTAVREYKDARDRVVGKRTRGFQGSYNYSVTQYNSEGKVYKTSAPFRAGQTIHFTEYVYDDLLRPIETRFPNGGTQYVTYYIDGEYSAILTQDTLNNESTKLYDSLGREKVSIDAFGTNATYQHDALGNVVRIEVKGINGESPIVHSIDYDLLSRKTQLNDPDTGVITYNYNAFGHLVSQTNAVNETIKYTYDKLDRQLTRKDPASTTDPNVRTHIWIYDNKANGIGMLGEVTGFDTQGRAFKEEYFYNALGQLEETVQTIDGNNYSLTNHYDGIYRPLGLTYPTGFTVQYQYNEFGRRSKVFDPESEYEYWVAVNDDAYGHLTEFSFGNEASTLKTYDPIMGLIDTIKVQKGSEVVQDHIYDFDMEGNLRSREDKKHAVKQYFCYDSLYRLTSGSLNQVCSDVVGTDYSAAQYGYDIHGNILKKNGITDYQYGENAGPHAVTRANGQSFVYDAAGRMTGGTGRIVEYSAFGKPVYMSKNSYQTQIVYSPLEKRIRRIDIESGVLTTTTYVDKLYEKIESTTGTEHRLYLGDFGIHVTPSTGSSYTVYQHFDHIGSIAAKTDDKSSSPTKFHANEPWGQRQEKTWNGTIYPNLSGAKLKELTYGTTRGFTGHEHLDGVGLIHMNGRVYDPTIGRFLTPDPWIQDPKNPQSFNRYSYVWNNPLRYTDPTGEFIPLAVWGAIKLISAGVALYTAYETGNAIGENINAVAAGEKTVGEAATDVAVEAGTNAVLNATGTRFVKVADKVAPELTTKVVNAVKDKIDNIRVKDKETAQDLKSKPESTQTETKVDVDAPEPKNVDRQCCFVAGTLVVTEGGLKPIEDIKIGDLVLSKNVETGEKLFKPVVTLFKKYRPILSVQFVSEEKEFVIETTDDHPFYVVGKGWVNAIELTDNDIVETDDGINAIVNKLVNQIRIDTTYNFEVADFHTYFVTKYELLVHNAPCTYEVPGERTASGKPYIGMTGKDDPSLRPGNGQDGVFRKAEDKVTDMPNSTVLERRIQEQKEINAKGGIDKLDNDINSVKEEDWEKYGIEPPPKTVDTDCSSSLVTGCGE